MAGGFAPDAGWARRPRRWPSAGLEPRGAAGRAARGLSRYGYGDLNLAEVAAEAGYTPGALYHLFADKEDLALAVVEWVWETWQEQVAPLADAQDEPLEALVALARGHVAYCRDGRARVMMTLRVEFAEREHPVGKAVARIAATLAAASSASSCSGAAPARSLRAPRLGSWRPPASRRSRA